MINVSQAIKNSCKADKNTHTEYIIINNQTIYIKGKLSATAYKDTTFFGTFNMKVLEFETENTTQFRNREFEYYKVIDGNAFKVGTFITTQVVDNDSKSSIKVTANDYALKFAVPYTSELDYSSGNITLYDVLEECCNQVGVELENKFIDNNSFKVDSNQFVNGELVGDVICAIAGISGNFATITNEDKLRLTFTNGTGAEQTTTIDGSTQINASGFKDIDLLGNTTQNGTPTPSSPIPVNVVSGDNEINVVGKNLLDTTQPNVVNFTSNWGKSAMPLNNNLVLKAGSYTMSLDIKSASGKVFNKIIFVDVDNNEYTWTIYVAIPTTYTSYNHTFTFNNDIVVKRIDYQNGGDGSETFYLNNIQLEKGSSATAYEPYQGNTYNIDLPVENLFDKDNANYVNGWIDSTTMRLNTNNGNRMFYISCKPNTTYTISRSIITSSFRTTTYDSTPFPTVTGSNVDYTVSGVLKNDSGTTLTITTGANAKYLVVHYGKVEDTNLNETLATIQVEYGNKANTYTPYGTTPIELCKIGTYQDRIFKSSGKNILDLNGTSGTLAGITYTITNNGVILNGTANADAYIRLATYTNNEGNIFNNKKFTITETKTGLLTYADYYENNTWKASQNASVNGTTLNISYPETRIILKISSGTALNNYILFPMISDDGGSYEPYGNYWYKYNAIGKVVLDGSENWITWNDVSTDNTRLFGTNNYDDIKKIGYIGICNYFINSTTTLWNANTQGMQISATGSQTIRFRINKTLANDLTTFKTWLSTHNTIVYYVLATPTYTKIENDELIGQLDSIKTLDLFDGINNITTNAPFLLTYLDDNVEVLEDYVDLDDKRDTQPITSVSIGTSQVEGQEAILRDENLIAQYGEHWLVINDNPFGYTLEKRQQLVKAIFDKVKGFGYSSFKSEYSYRPYLELGDKIKFKNKNGDLIDSAILRYNFDFDNCTFEAPSITSASVDYELSPDANELAKRAEIIANQADASISMITGELGIVDGQSQVINGIIQYQDKNSAIIQAISSSDTTTDENGNIVPTGVKTSTGFTFDKDGLKIQKSDSTYNSLHNERGEYYFDGTTPLGETTPDGSKFKNMDIYGEFRYGKDEINETAMFVGMLFKDTIIRNGQEVTEECFGHFFNGRENE